MQLDIRTLAFILGLLHILQVLVFVHQFLTNRSHRGIGWWLGWCVAETAGFASVLLREVSPNRDLAILAQNALIVLGVVLLYIGLTRFLDRKAWTWPVLASYALYFAGLVYTCLLHDDIQLRSLFFSAALAGYSFLSAGILLAHHRRVPAFSSGLLTAALLAHGVYFGIRAGVIAAGQPVDPIFVPSAFNLAGMLDGIVMAVLWTVGLILLINRRLNAEVTEAKEHFELIFTTSPDAVLISGLEDGRIVNLNEGFTALTGYTRQEAIGRSTLELAVWEDPAERLKVVQLLRQNGACENYEAVYRTKSGGRITVVTSAKIIRLRGRPHIIGVTHDISARKRDEERIRSLLKEKELLLKEVHHRIKNNISSMMSLLSLQAGTATDPGAAAALKAARDRMRSMALLYDRLYRADIPRQLSIADYLPRLIDEIVAVFPKEGPVSVEKKIEDVTLGAKILLPLGIILNELLSNALKHAFVGRTGGAINVTAAGRDGRVVLTIADDGVGLPEAAGAAEAPGFGLQLVDMLTAQIDGTLRVERGGGTRFVLEFPR